MRILAFVLALLLLAGTVDPTTGWLIALVVLTGFGAFRLHSWNGFAPRVALDVRLASFVLAVLLLAGAIDASKDWLIVLSAVTGVAAFMPRLIALDRDDPYSRSYYWRSWYWHPRRSRTWAIDWDKDDWR